MLDRKAAWGPCCAQLKLIETRGSEQDACGKLLSQVLRDNLGLAFESRPFLSYTMGFSLLWVGDKGNELEGEKKEGWSIYSQQPLYLLGFKVAD